MVRVRSSFTVFSFFGLSRLGPDSQCVASSISSNIKLQISGKSRNSANTEWGYLRLRGLPYDATANTVLSFLDNETVHVFCHWNYLHWFSFGFLFTCSDGLSLQEIIIMQFTGEGRHHRMQPTRGPYWNCVCAH